MFIRLIIISTILFINCAPITPLQSPRIDSGISFQVNGTLNSVENSKVFNSAVIESTDTNGTFIDTLHSSKPNINTSENRFLGSWYMNIGIKNRLEFSLGNINLVSGEGMLKVNIFDTRDKTFLRNHAFAIWMGGAYDFFPRYYVMSPAVVSRKYLGISWGLLSPIYRKKLQFEFIMSPNISLDSYDYNEHSNARKSIIYFNIPVGINYRFGYRQQFKLLAYLIFRPELTSSGGECTSSEFYQANGEIYEDGIIYYWDLDYSFVSLSLGVSVNIGTRKTRKLSREKYEILLKNEH